MDFLLDFSGQFFLVVSQTMGCERPRQSPIRDPAATLERPL